MNRMIEALNGIAAAWWDWTVASTWQGALLLSVVGVILAAGRSLRPGFRYGLLLVVLLKFALPPVFGVAYGFSDLLARAFSGVPAPALNTDVYEVVVAPPPPATATVPAPAPLARIAPQAPALSPLAWLLVLEVAGAGMLLFLIARQWRVARQLLRGGVDGDEPLRQRFRAAVRAMKLRRTPRLCLSDGASAPQSGGILRPFVLLPSWAAAMPADELEILLAHELAHVRRRDALVNGFQAAAQALLWWNPAVWWLNPRIREEREFCCDDLVLARGIASGEAYSRALVNVAERVSLPASPWAMAGMADNFRALDRRVRMALDGGHGRRGWGHYGAMVVVVLVAGWVLPGATDEATDERKEGFDPVGKSADETSIDSVTVNDAPGRADAEEELVIASEGTAVPEPENFLPGLEYQILNMTAERISRDHVKPGVMGPFGPRDHRMTVFEEVSLTLHSAQHAVDINIKAKRLEHTTGSDSDGLMVWEGDVEAQFAEFTAQAERLEFTSTFLFFNANLLLRDFGTVQAEQIRVDPVARRIDVLNGTVDEARLKEAFGENATYAPRGEWLTLPFAVVRQIVVDAWIMEVDRDADLKLPDAMRRVSENDSPASRTVTGGSEQDPKALVAGTASNEEWSVCKAGIMELVDAGRGKIVGAPKLITLDGQEATISIGTEVPYTQDDEIAYEFEGMKLGVLVSVVTAENGSEGFDIRLNYTRTTQQDPDATPPVFETAETAHSIRLESIHDPRWIYFMTVRPGARHELVAFRVSLVRPGGQPA
ncbi:MAG: hypothetical protein KF886_13365 [Candidatus Hydrogenedentes bacterium]|nr:hypothetical protein [Candidatus Hydrogenedentota bacterium]